MLALQEGETRHARTRRHSSRLSHVPPPPQSIARQRRAKARARAATTERARVRTGTRPRRARTRRAREGAREARVRVKPARRRRRSKPSRPPRRLSAARRRGWRCSWSRSGIRSSARLCAASSRSWCRRGAASLTLSLLAKHKIIYIIYISYHFHIRFIYPKSTRSTHACREPTVIWLIIISLPSYLCVRLCHLVGRYFPFAEWRA